MPARMPTNNPTIIAGTNFLSGDANTGQVMYSQGGARTFTKHSGTAGGAAVIYTGPGRLDWVQLHPGTTILASGHAMTLFDAAAAASGHTGSGSTVLFKGLPVSFAPNAGGLSFQSGLTVPGGGPLFIGAAFQSGLCHDSTSGQTGFSIGYTPAKSS